MAFSAATPDDWSAARTDGPAASDGASDGVSEERVRAALAGADEETKEELRRLLAELTAVGAAETGASAGLLGVLAARFARRLDQLEAESTYIDRLAVRAGGRFIFVRVEEVEWVEAAGNYVRLHCAAGRTHMIRSGINDLERRLSPRLFCRIHRSLLVRRDRIKEIAPIYQGEYTVVLETGTRLQSSRAYRGRIRQLISGAA